MIIYSFVSLSLYYCNYLTKHLTRCCYYVSYYFLAPFSTSAHLSLAYQLSLQVVNLEKGTADTESTHRPHRPHRPPRRMRWFRHSLDLLHALLPESAPDVAADWVRLEHAIVWSWQFWQRQILKVSMRHSPQAHGVIRCCSCTPGVKVFKIGRRTV